MGSRTKTPPKGGKKKKSKMAKPNKNGKMPKNGGKEKKPKSKRELIQGLRQKQADECLAEIDIILCKYECQLVGIPFIKPDGTIGANAGVATEG